MAKTFCLYACIAPQIETLDCSSGTSSRMVSMQDICGFLRLDLLRAPAEKNNYVSRLNSINSLTFKFEFFFGNLASLESILKSFQIIFIKF